QSEIGEAQDTVLPRPGRIERYRLPQQRGPRAPQALKNIPVSGRVSAIVTGARSVPYTLAHAGGLFARKLRVEKWLIHQQQRFRRLAIGPDDPRSDWGVERQLHIVRRDGGARTHRGSPGCRAPVGRSPVRQPPPPAPWAWPGSRRRT